MTLNRVKFDKDNPAEGYEQEADHNADAVDVRGVYVQNDTSNDTNVLVSRDASNNLTLTDSLAGTLTLSQLASGGGKGSTILDFGSSYSNNASVVVTGQTSIVAGSAVKAWIVAVLTTDHSADEHVMESAELELLTGNIVAGTGFTIYGTDSSPGGQYGKFTIAWSWS